MGATRWEAERAAAVMARSRAGTSARRRAEILARRARQAGREGTGVAGTAVHQEVTPPIWRRAMAHDDGAEAGARLFFLAIGGAVVLWVFWPGILLGAALYGGLLYGGPADRADALVAPGRGRGGDPGDRLVDRLHGPAVGDDGDADADMADLDGRRPAA